MREKNDKKRKVFFLKIIIIFFTIILIINLIPVILIYNSTFLFKRIFNRDLTFNKIKYLPHKLYLEVENVSLKKENLELLSIKKIKIDFDYIKLLQLKPTISYIEIENPVTFFIKSNNRYLLPDYIQLNKKNVDKNIKKIDFPITIEHIVLKEGRIDLLENNRLKTIAKDITVILPGIKNTNKIEIEPIISGKIFNKEFIIKGESKLKEDSLMNRFFLDLKDFNLYDFSIFIPLIFGIKIVSGSINTKLNLIFITHKNRSPEFKIDGYVEVNNLNLYDVNAKIFFLKYVDLKAVINSYDLFNNSLSLNKIDVKNGNINLVFKDKDSSIFFLKKNKKRNIFKFTTKEANFLNNNFNFYDGINSQNFNFFLNELKIKNFDTYENKKFDFYLNCKSEYFLDSIKAKGNFNINSLNLNLEEVEINGLVFDRLLFVKKIFKKLETLTLKKFRGQISYLRNEIKINGEIECTNFYIIIDQYKNKLGAEKIKFYLNEFNSQEKFFSFKYLEVYNGIIPVDKKDSLIKNITFSLKDNKIKFTEKLNDKKEKIIFISENINIEKISSNFISENKNFETIIDGINFQIKLEINQDRNKLLSSGDFIFDSLMISTENRPVFKISNIFISVYKFEIFPIVININSIEADSPYIVIDIKKDKKLYLLSLNEISFKKVENDIKVNIDKIKFNSGRIVFTDYSLEEIFKIDFSNVEGEIKNFPSFVYPEGKMEVNGIINKRNSFKIISSLSHIFIKGNLKTEDLLVSQFSPYFNNYLGYKINSGILDLEIPFEIKDENLNAEVNLRLNNLKLTKVSSKKKLDLSRMVTVIEDENGNINLNIPIQGKWGAPNIDFREIFFNIFYDILDNSQKTFTNINQINYKKDGVIDVIYFKEGSDETTSNIDTFISESLKSKFTDSRKIFVIEGYVDKLKDSDYLRRKILRDKILLYGNIVPVEDSKEEFEVLKKIYFELYKRELKENVTNKDLKKILIDKIELTDSDYYSLSYARVKRVKKFLIDNYNLKEEKIVINESNIYENPYVTGVGNSLVVIVSCDK